MRTILILFLLGLFACQTASNVEEATPQSPFTSESAQLFSIGSDSASLIKGKHGSMLEIPANAFVLENGQEPKGLIQLELKEAFTKGSMLTNKLSTTSDGKLIESTGMVYIAADNEGRTLKLKTDKEIRLSIPNKEAFAKADFFEGSFNEKGIMDWKLVENTIDTLIIHQQFVTGGYSEAGSYDSVIIRKYMQIGDTLIQIAGDKVDSKFDNQDTVTTESESAFVLKEAPIYFQFSVKNLGWINCDRFLDIDNPTTLTVNLKDRPQALAYLVFHNQNSIMELYFDNRSALASRLPQGEQVSLLVIDKKEDQYYFHKQPLKLGEQETIHVTLQEVPLTTIQEEVQKFDQKKENSLNM